MAQQDNKKPAVPESRPHETEAQDLKPLLPKEVNGPKGPEPTRYGDWEKNGRCIDF
jgi:hypothetical protein